MDRPGRKGTSGKGPPPHLFEKKIDAIIRLSKAGGCYNLFFMSFNRQLLLVTVGVIVISLLMVSGATYFLYLRGLAEQEDHLTEELDQWGSMIRAVAEWDYRTLLEMRPEEEDPAVAAWKITRGQIREADRLFAGSGETAAYVLASREGEKIIFHLKPVDGKKEPSRAMDADTPNGEAIRRALSGESGYMRGFDFDGVPVFAAYRPLNLNGLQFGVVAQMDVAEVKEAYIHGWLLALGVTLPFSLLAAWILVRFGHSLISKLQETNLRFEGTFEQAGVGLAHVGLDGSWLRVNRKLCEIVGYSKGELYGRRFQDITHPEDLDNDLKLFQKLTDGRIPTYSIKKRYFHKDGHLVWIRLTTAMQRDEEGERLYCISVIEDITEKLEIDEQLKKSEAYLSYISESIGLRVWEYNVGEKRFLKSPALGRAMGYEPEEMTDHRSFIEDRLHPEDKERAVGYLEAYLENPEGRYSQEFRVRHKEGYYCWVRSIGGPVFNQAGELTHVAGVHFDVTEERMAQLQLQEQHAQFYRIFDSFPEMLYVIDPETYEILFANRAFHEKLGGNIDGLICHRAIHGLPEPCPFCTVDKLRKVPKGKPLFWEHYFPKLDRYFLIIDQLIEWTDRKEVRMEIAIDISERKKNEKELQTLSQELLELNTELHLQGTALRAAANGIVITDTEGAILWINPAFEDLYGYTFEEVKGRNPRMLKSGMQKKAFYREMWETILAGDSWSGELSNRTKSGKEVVVALTITPILDEEGKIWRFVGIANNITEERDLQQQVIQAQRMEGIGTLAGGIAHDLNNILAPILISSEMLLGREDLDERTREYLGIIHKSSRRGADVVSQLLTFARGQAGQKDVFDLTFLVKEMVKMMQETFPRNILISYHLCEDPDPVLGDPTQLQQVLLNLCVNARDAMPEGGQITLSLENRDHSGEEASCCARGVILTVSDTGVGMEPEVQERIFEPFFTTKEIGKGTGLGLSTVVGLVKSHGGTIEVDSTSGKGTTFTLCIPSAVEEQKEGKPDPLTDMGSDYPGKGERILLVDDEESILVSLIATLEQAGYAVETASDGKEGLKRFMEDPDSIDLVLTDSNMPNMGGRRMLNYIHEHRPEVPCLVMTGRVDAETGNLESTFGKERLLLKPFDPVTLLRLLRETLSGNPCSSPPPDS